MAEQINVSISQESVQAIISAQVQAAVTSALMGNSEDLVNTLVKSALLTQSKDERYRYSSKAPTVLEHLVTTMIQEETEKAVKAWADANRKEIADKIASVINKRSFANKWATCLVDSLLSASQYNFSTHVTLAKKED